MTYASHGIREAIRAFQRSIFLRGVGHRLVSTGFRSGTYSVDHRHEYPLQIYVVSAEEHGVRARMVVQRRRKGAVRSNTRWSSGCGNNATWPPQVNNNSHLRPVNQD